MVCEAAAWAPDSSKDDQEVPFVYDNLFILNLEKHTGMRNKISGLRASFIIAFMACKEAKTSERAVGKHARSYGRPCDQVVTHVSILCSTQSCSRFLQDTFPQCEVFSNYAYLLERFLNSNLVPQGQYLYQLKFQNKECKQETYLILSSIKDRYIY